MEVLGKNNIEISHKKERGKPYPDVRQIRKERPGCGSTIVSSMPVFDFPIFPQLRIF